MHWPPPHLRSAHSRSAVTTQNTQQYAAPEEVFCKLLLTPELDAKLKQQPGDSSSNIDNDTQELQHAAHIVEAAVAEAIRIAYGNNANSSASHAAASTTTTSSNAPSSASPQQQQHQQDDDQGGGGSEFGCVALGSDDQCVVDWDSESLWDNAAATGSGTFGDSYDGAEATDADASSSTSAAANAPADGGGAAGGDGAAAASHVAVSASVDGLAHAAVALEGATGESFEVASAHTFLQRLLYRINRLNHFWWVLGWRRGCWRGLCVGRAVVPLSMPDALLGTQAQHSLCLRTVQGVRRAGCSKRGL